MCAASRRGGSISSSRASGCGSRKSRGQPDRRAARRAGAGVPGAAVGGPLPVSVRRRQGREGPRRRPRRAQVRRDRARRARDRPARDHRPGRRRGGDRGVLARVPAQPGRARPGRRAAGHLRRAPGPEGRAGAGARRAVAALHRALPARPPRPRPHATSTTRSARSSARSSPPPTASEARQRLRDAVGQLERRLPKVAALLEEAEARRARLLRVPGRALAQAALHEPAGALQPRDRPAHRRRRHLPRRRLA